MLDSGFWIGGFGLGEGMEERPALLNAVTVREKSEYDAYKLQIQEFYGVTEHMS